MKLDESRKRDMILLIGIIICTYKHCQTVTSKQINTSLVGSQLGANTPTVGV